MATSQMEEMVIFKQRDRAIAAIVDRHPYTNLHVQDEHYILRVIAPDAHEWLTLDTSELGKDWTDLVESVEDARLYGNYLPDYGYHWVEKKVCHDWFLDQLA